MQTAKNIALHPQSTGIKIISEFVKVKITNTLSFLPYVCDPSLMGHDPSFSFFLNSFGF